MLDNADRGLDNRECIRIHQPKTLDVGVSRVTSWADPAIPPGLPFFFVWLRINDSRPRNALRPASSH